MTILNNSIKVITQFFIGFFVHLKIEIRDKKSQGNSADICHYLTAEIIDIDLMIEVSDFHIYH